MDVLLPGRPADHFDLARGLVTLGRRGGGADVPLGRTDEAQLSATAAFLHPQPGGSPDPLQRGRWILQHTNELALCIAVLYPNARAVELHRAGALEVLASSAALEFRVPRGALTVELHLPASEVPRPTVVPEIDPPRSGGTDPLIARLRWTDRRRAVIGGMFPDLVNGRRPRQVRSAASVAAELGMQETTVRFHADEVRKELARVGIDTDSVGVFHVDLGRLIHDHQLFDDHESRHTSQPALGS